MHIPETEAYRTRKRNKSLLSAKRRADKRCKKFQLELQSLNERTLQNLSYAAWQTFECVIFQVVGLIKCHA